MRWSRPRTDHPNVIDTAGPTRGRLTEAEIARVRARLATGASMNAVLTEAHPDLVAVHDVVAAESEIRSLMMGVGPVLQPLLNDHSVTDVLINGVHSMWVDRGHGMERTTGARGGFQRESEVRALAVRLAAVAGARLDEQSPIVDGMLAGTIRLHAVIPPLAAEGTLISLRIHRPVGMTVKDLAERGMIHREIVPVVMALIQHKANVMISGATGSGKTTFLSAALGEIPSDQRIIIIEEAPELRPTHPHVVHLRERRPNVEGAGAVPMSELVRAAMRMRPDRIILGECRGPEVRDVLSALNTGHDGGWATIHANSAADVPSRLVALGATAGMSESFTYLQANAALDAIVHLEKRRHPAHHSAIRVLSQIAVLRARGASIEAIPAVMLCGNECCRGPGWEDLVRRVGGNMEGAKGVEKSLRIAPEDCVSPTDARC